MTIRDRVAAIQRELRDSDIQPARAREMAIELAGLMPNVHAEVLDAEMAYNAVLLAAFRTEETANRAKLAAEVTEEYRRLRMAKDIAKDVSGMKSTLNTVLRSLETEMRMGA